MQASQIPNKFTLPFASGAGPGFIRTVPVASQIGIQPGAASETDGFPPLNFLPVGSGGVPPFGQDANGILNKTTAWDRWFSAGGPVQWDSVFSATWGGYPAGATVQSTVTLGLFWFCTIDNNTTNPDSGGAGWLSYSPVGSVTRIVTASGIFVTNISDGAVGLNRTSSPAVSSTTLPTGVSQGKIIVVEDLAANFNAFPVTIFAPAGMTIAGLPSVVMNINRQSSTFRFYGSNLWGVRL